MQMVDAGTSKGGKWQRKLLCLDEIMSPENWREIDGWLVIHLLMIAAAEKLFFPIGFQGRNIPRPGK